MSIDELKDRIARAEEIQRYTENRCKALEKENAEAKEIIKKYLAIGVGGKITQNYLDVTKEAEQFLNGENIILEDAQAGNSPFDADKVFNKEMKAYPDRKVK